METDTKIFIGGFILLFILFTISAVLTTFSFITFVMMLLYFVVFIMIFVMMRYFAKLEEDKFNKQSIDENSFPYCWNQTNLLLEQMPGADGIVWQEGAGVYSTRQYYKVNNESIPFIGFLARNARTKRFVNIIYDIKNKNIVRYSDDPSSDVLNNNPFHDFEPEKNTTMSDGFGGMPYGMPNRNGRRSYGMRSSFGNSFPNYGLGGAPGLNVNIDTVGNNAQQNTEQKRRDEAKRLSEKLK